MTSTHHIAIDVGGTFTDLVISGADGRARTLLSRELAGGGGWGNPFERVPESVLQDVLDEKVSRAGAARDYGVTVNGEGMLDMTETARLRSARRAAE